MKSRLSLIFAALVVLLGTMMWVVQDRRTPARAAAAVTITPVPTPAPAPAALPEVAAAVAVMPAPLAAAPVVTPAAVKPAPMVHVDPSGAVRYVARSGDTIADVAVALLGSDSEDHRDAVAAVNVSLQSNPDRVVAGQTYSIDTSPAETDAAVAAAVPNDAPAGATAASPAGPAAGPKLKYIARPGDTVAVLAGNLLGGDTAANREAIIAANESLRDYPSHLIAGKTYTILVPEGMASDPAAPQAKTSAAAQPDADDAVQQGAGRTLRYTARSGDTVSKLAVALLGSDTPANQELIVQSNPTLKLDPDHLVAGRTYWISAPDAE